MKNMEDEPEDSLHFDNQLRKLKLSAETGAQFLSEEDGMSPTVESQFIDHIEAFNKAAQHKESRKIKEILGNPDLPSPQVLTSEKLPAQLEKAYNMLNENNIALDVLYDVSEAEIYRFIVEELLEYDLNIIDIPDLVSQFTYEEFHPNHEEDIKRYADEFITMLSKRSFDFMDHTLASHVSFQDQQLTSEEFVDKIKSITADVQISPDEFEILNMTIGDDNAHIKSDIYSNGQKETIVLHFAFDFGYWYISGLQWTIA